MASNPSEALNIEVRRIFLIVTADLDRQARLAAVLRRHFAATQIFTAVDGADARFKMRNVPPHVLVTDLDLPKVDGRDLIQDILKDDQLRRISVIVSSGLPEAECFVDQVVNCQVQFVREADDEDAFVACVTRALNRLSHLRKAEYFIRFIEAGARLFGEGEACECVYIVRRGNLRAIRQEGGQPVVLGDIFPGEFVGEMAHLNHEPRSATVVALTDCELIEIPSDTIDVVLFSKPAWAKALATTLARRLRGTNKRRAAA